MTTCTECGHWTDEMEPTVTSNTVALFRAQLLCPACRYAVICEREIEDVKAAERERVQPFDRAALDRLKYVQLTPERTIIAIERIFSDDTLDELVS